MRGLAVIALVALGCTKPHVPGENVLVIISDDIGEDRTGVYAVEGADTFTPNLDALAAEGVRFTNVYSNPTCSPSRSTLMTGRYATRHGVGRWIFPRTEEYDLNLDELTIPEMLDQHAEGSYTSAAVGKWHMVRFSRANPQRHPLQQGFAHHRGGLANPLDATNDENRPRSYTNWQKNVDGNLSWSETYMTTDTTNEALTMIEELPEPWFLWVAYNAAHTPLHVPPDDLNPMGVTEDSSEYDLYDADTLAWDMELGRLLDGIDPEMREELTIVYLADNGTPDHAIRAPYDSARHKATTYEGGVRVPMIVTGPHVTEPGSVSSALVNFTDLFPTLADIANVDVETLTYTDGARRGEAVELDGFSLLPYLEDPATPSEREFLFTEAFYPNGPGPYEYRRRTVRTATHKLRREEANGGKVFNEYYYRLEDGAIDEGNPISLDTASAEDRAAFDALLAEMDRLAADLSFDW